MKKVQGVGCLGFGKYSPKNHLKAYNIWRGVLRRCYDNKSRSTDSMYKDCSVHTDWHNFQNFAKWFEENYVEGYSLDKDLILKGNKIYSPDTCCFLPQCLNSIFVNHKSSRNGLIGATKNGNKYSSTVKIKNKYCYLGNFNLEIEAFNAYKKAKEKSIKSIALEYKNKISQLAFECMMKYQVEITD